MDKLELYYDHYKEAFTLSKEAQKRRNRDFVILCFLEAISFLILIKPDVAFEALLDGIKYTAGTALSLSHSILQTLLWVLITYVLIRYCQDTLYVEKSYKYLNMLEKEISKLLDENFFDREGNNYLNNYPIVLNLIDLFYKMFSPILFFVINIIHIIKEWHSIEALSLALICDSLMLFAISVITWFYFFELHTKITAYFLKNPFIKYIAKLLHKLLKEV